MKGKKTFIIEYRIITKCSTLVEAEDSGKAEVDFYNWYDGFDNANVEKMEVTRVKEWNN